MLLAAVGHHLLRFARERRARARLRQLHQQAAPAAPTWVVLMPQWYRANRPILESVVKPALERGAAVGVLLFGRLEPGMRSESNLRRRVGDELWPGLGPLLPELGRCPVDQVSSAESLAALGTLLARAARFSARALLRLARHSPRLHVGALHFNLDSRPAELAKLATQDVIHALLASAAARAAVARQAFRGATVVLPGPITDPTEVIANAALQRAGAFTIEFMHGSVGSGWLACSYVGAASQRCMWTEADAAAQRDLGFPTIVAGMPATVTPQRREAGQRATRVLIASNYVHRDTAENGRFPTRVFQEELLEVVAVLREEFGLRFAFRWRPHPADKEALVAATLARYPGVELSRGRELAEDAAWADIIVSSLSSVVAEVLPADVPLFVHVLPMLAETHDVACFDQERCFFRAAELRLPFRRCVAALDARDVDALAPERRARVALFGSSGTPISLDAWLQRRGAAPPRA